MKPLNLTLMTEDIIRGLKKENFNLKTTLTDFVILNYQGNHFSYFIKDQQNTKEVRQLSLIGDLSTCQCTSRRLVRPCFFHPKDYVIDVSLKKEFTYGFCPQSIVDDPFIVFMLNDQYDNKVSLTGNNYTIDGNHSNTDFKPLTFEEYEFQGKRYIRVETRTPHFSRQYGYSMDFPKLSNGDYPQENYYWVEVSPISWIYIEKYDLAIAKQVIMPEVQYRSGYNKSNLFETSNIKRYLDNYLSKEFMQVYNEEIDVDNYIESNIFNLNFDEATEEEKIIDCIKSNIPVFLHGQSSDGKSARIKQIDPNCEIIYLRNATPESLNGKSVYVQPIIKSVSVPVIKEIIDPITNEKRTIEVMEEHDEIIKDGYMLDVKPTWLVNLENKCQREPNKIHLLFFDELTNALPSIQGMAFNIILDHEINGKWKLPNNVRIVAAGNEAKDSLSANKMVEPLFNRFAHVYIKTNLDNWLKWAVKNNIHPNIIAYMSYKSGETLRTKYDGIKPNADPRKWEMASKLLYATGSVNSLTSLIGEELTADFLAFCSLNVITLKDVLNSNYNLEDLSKMNHAEIYSTIISLLSATPEEYSCVKEFLNNFPKEYQTLFTSLWATTDEKIEAVIINEQKNKTLTYKLR